MQVARDADRVLQQPAAVGVQRYAGFREALVQRTDGLDFFLATQHAAFELEIGKTIALVSGLCQAHDALGIHGLFVAQAEPVVVGTGLGAVGQVGLFAVAHVEQVTQHLHGFALHTLAQQRGHGHVEVLAQQVEKGRLHRCHGVDGDAQVEGLQPAPARIAVGELGAHGVEHGVVVADGAAHDQRSRVLDGLADLLAARHLAHTGVARAVAQDDQVAREERAVRAAQVHEHAVVARHGHHAQFGDDGGAAGRRGRGGHGGQKQGRGAREAASREGQSAVILRVSITVFQRANSRAW